MHFGLDNIFKQYQLVEGCSKPATVQVHSSLSLNLDDWIENIVVCNLPIDTLHWLLKLPLELKFWAVWLGNFWNHWFVQILERLLRLFFFRLRISLYLRFKFSWLIVCPFVLKNIFLVCQVELTSLFSCSKLFNRRHHFPWRESISMSGKVFHGSLHRSEHLIQSSSFELSCKNLNLLYFYTSNHTASVSLNRYGCFYNRSLSISTLFFQLVKSILHLSLVFKHLLLNQKLVLLNLLYKSLVLAATLTIDCEVSKWFIVRCRRVCSWHQFLDLVVGRWNRLFYSTLLLLNSAIRCKHPWETLTTHILLLVNLSFAPRLLAVMDELFFKYFIEGLIQKLSSILLVTLTRGARWLALFALLRIKFARCAFFKGDDTASNRFLWKTTLVC